MLLTTREAASRLRRTPDTVLRMIRDGRLSAVKGPGRTSAYLIDEADIAAYLDAHRVEASR